MGRLYLGDERELDPAGCSEKREESSVGDLRGGTVENKDRCSICGDWSTEYCSSQQRLPYHLDWGLNLRFAVCAKVSELQIIVSRFK